MTRQFKSSPAAVSETPLLIGLEGPPGGGKSYSALRLATGMCRVRGGEPFVVDTEGGRARKYAGQFKFRHVPFEPPYKPSDFLTAIEYCVKEGAGAVVIDSASDEHEGSGGVLDWHDEELDRMAGSDWSKRERVGQAAWIKPKASRRAFINGILRITTPLIFCFRAREKVKQVKNDRGKMEPTNIGFQPIAPIEIVHTLDLVCLLPPRAEGVPVWSSDKAGEDFILKLPEFLKPFIRDGEPLSEDMGAAFARWAKGESVTSSRDHVTTSQVEDGPKATPYVPSSEKSTDDLIEEAKAAKSFGTEALKAFWQRLTPAQKKAVGGTDALTMWKADAELADQERAKEAAE